MMNDKMLFVAWIAHSRRGQLMAEKFRMKLYLVHSLKRHPVLAPVRHVLQAIKTLKILFRERPAVVFVQNPPIFAPLVVYLYAKLSGTRYVIDAHTTALLSPWWKWSLPLHGFLSRQAIATIVTNEHLKAMVESWGAKAVIVADIPAVFPQGRAFSVNGGFSVAVINTFAPDEPLEEVLKAATSLPDVRFYITGDPIRARKEFLQNHPDNVTFTGFLPDVDYIGLLRAVQAIMVLTTRDHTMQRGACEAVSLGQPIITSNWPLLRAYFDKGTVHVDNSSQGIRAGILRMQEVRETLKEEVLVLRRERWLEWEGKRAAITELITGG